MIRRWRSLAQPMRAASTMCAGLEHELHWKLGRGRENRPDSEAGGCEFKWLRCRNSCGRNCSAEYDFEFG
jgi:hypothetical protein